MAQLAVNSGDPGGYTMGQVASFEMPSSVLHGPSYAVPVEVGSSGGVPPANSIAGEQPSGSASSAVNYGNTATARPAYNQPILWLFIFMAIGVIILAGHARAAVRSI